MFLRSSEPEYKKAAYPLREWLPSALTGEQLLSCQIPHSTKHEVNGDGFGQKVGVGNVKVAVSFRYVPPGLLYLLSSQIPTKITATPAL